ncbi:MAG TPA: amino acid--[acyl-carrier-protein] ligase [Acidimicrobiales bacterium]|nr:amino acid--[acyl-carrier-protein] ligase [Acidimicrobiales bacterium]
MNDSNDFGEALVAAGILYPTGVPGVSGRSQRYLDVVKGLHALVDGWGSELGATQVQFPPIVNRTTFEQTNYIQSFPDLMGVVTIFTGDDRDHAELCRRSESGKDWHDLLEPAEVFLASAACHPVYPMCTGTLPAEGRYFNVESYCFRHEPSSDPARMQSFQMHEVVRVGSPDQAQEHRDRGLEHGISLLGRLGLDVTVVTANDPFFGRLGTVMAHNQKDEALKLEGTAPIGSPDHPVAIISGNCHRDHFGTPFSIHTAQGAVAHSACVAFGIDRVTLALFWKHGFEPDGWPAEVRAALWP